MKVYVKKFTELTTIELYYILQLRSEVFVVEQECIFQDLDNKDQIAYHVLGVINEQIISYARVFNSGDYFSKPSIGRIIVKKEKRNFKYGYQLVEESIRFIDNNFQEKTIIISAQKYLTEFYNSLGFIQQGEGYLEDGIPHIKMVKN